MKLSELISQLNSIKFKCSMTEHVDPEVSLTVADQDATEFKVVDFEDGTMALMEKTS